MGRRRGARVPGSADVPITLGHMAVRPSWASSPAVRATMRGNRGRDTRPELALRRAVHAQGLRYFVNRRPVKTIRRTADLVFPTAQLAVFLDGCFWHGCPMHHVAPKANADFWAEKVTRNRERDAQTDHLLADKGWTVLRVWEHVPVDEAVDLVVQGVAHCRAARTAPSGARPGSLAVQADP